MPASACDSVTYEAYAAYYAYMENLRERATLAEQHATGKDTDASKVREAQLRTEAHAMYDRYQAAKALIEASRKFDTK
ncbi:hypothetical protein BQ8482_380202 [Mesorhizobium delmotii]|uniref:Uncharacterized protein n=1 Tax=Mesorhizobium delmotii TaxID=1631247 RepID=A0A2P9AS85_9HYPH|nr:hypothetical protein BQ8482_380202 [Mesorhizobium delmotii]